MDISLNGQLDQVRRLAPLVLSITNPVTINECANALLAIGASPVMSADENDATALATLAAATVLNIGTINDHILKIALAAGGGARKAGHLIILDPVGVGATVVRKKAANTIISELKPDIIRGNFAEIVALTGDSTVQKGVDSRGPMSLTPAIEITEKLARQLGCVVAITGAIDVVSDGKLTFTVAGGSPLLPKITGSGCLLTAMIGAYAGANAHTILQATIAAMSHLALAGERAAAGLAIPESVGSFRVALFDHLGLITGEDLNTHAPQITAIGS